MLFQIIFLIKYLRRRLSLVELLAYNSFNKAKLFHKVFIEFYFEQLIIIEQLLVAASETHEFKHMYQMLYVETVFLQFEKFFIMNKQMIPPNISLEYP